ncbi:C-factor isoform X1 [Vanessa atalanta]|uniref:C-factor isoform X1 n=1 Tax=Vanessa atalanta TaxID=42275 RepID=UPI001FCDD330|nr:C-factor isoform X1 [Vanessa atalanta]
MKSVLITGANRGLGLGMVKYLTKNDKARIIFATCRKPSEELTNLSQEHKNLHILNLDVTNFTKIGEIASEVSKVVGSQGLNVLINNAGVTTKFTKLQLVKAEQLLENLTVNTIAPIMLTKSLHPILKQAVEANSDKLIGAQRAVVINMSSILGSIALNDQGGFYPYRCSKAALNAATKSMSIDLKKDQIVVAALHPGWVKTDMGGKNAPLDVDTSVSGIFNTIEKLKEADSGKFLQYDGTELAW